MLRSLGVSVLILISSTVCALSAPLNQAKYVTMPDGVRIAVEIWLPPELKAHQKIPAMIAFTRYWRARDYLPQKLEPPTLAKIINGFGYAYVVADVRGSGASFGSRSTEFSTAEVKDYYYIVDEIAKESWSSGKVGAIGVSYLGNAAELSTLSGHPALKVVVPQFTDYDWYSSLLFPGGLKNRIMSSEWGDMVQAMDLNDAKSLGYDETGNGEPRVLGIKPVDGAQGRQQLSSAVEEHRGNVSMSRLFDGVEFRDDLKVAGSLSDASDHSVTIFAFKEKIEALKVPAFHWGSWMDAGTADGILKRFASDTAPNRYIIGAWGHGARHDADPFKQKDEPLSPDLVTQYGMIRDFVTPYFDDRPENVQTEKALTYYTMGSGRWKTTKVWPPLGAETQRLYLRPQRELGEARPQSRKGTDSYTVDFEAGTGPETRWSTQMGNRDVFYGDRRDADSRLLTYTSRPLESPLEITGHPVVNLYVSSTHADGALIVYLESVAPGGEVTMITEGQLRLSSRKAVDSEERNAVFGPVRTFRRADAKAMRPGVSERVSFPLLPVSVEVPKGHALRIAIAGHDKDSFFRIPKAGTPVLKFDVNAVRSSFIDLPIVRP